MGEVHRARAFGAAGVTKELCVKRIRCERLADPASLARFVSEARLSMRLSHANIVSVFDFGRSQGDYYLAMEWVEGCDLRRLLAGHDGRALDEDVALLVATEVARALAYLHALDGDGHIAHCDLKPANVLLSRAGEVKLADFGVAAHEAAGLVGGTRRYMAPEQRRAGAVGPASDLYALGLVLDEMVGGRAARSAPSDDAPADAPWPVYEAPATSKALAALLTRLCALDPAERPASAREVLDELESLLAEARVRQGRSPRELLARRVSESAVPVRDAASASDEEELRTDASFLTEGESETFARRMKPGASPRSESRATPLPPRPAPPPSRARWAGLGAVTVLALGLALWSGPTSPGAGAAAAPATTSAPAGAAEATEASPMTARGPDTRGAPATSGIASDGSADTASGEERASASTERRRAPASASPTVSERATPEEAAPEGTVLGAPAPPPSAAHVRVNARPWAEVRVDGRMVGVTPIVGLELPAGAHELELVNPALGRSQSVALTLAAGETRDVIVDLRATP